MANEKEITTEQDTDLIANRFTLGTPSLAHFLNETDDFNISMGYDGKNIEVIDGKADEWTVEWDQKQFTMSITGRDKLKLALETFFQKTYFLYQPSFDPVTEYNVAIPYSVGVIMASQVARDACTAAGLSLVWDCPDYPVVNDVEPSQGYADYVAEVLKALVKPFQETHMLQVDVFIEGETVYLRKRVYPFIADETLDISDARIKKIAVTKSNSRDKQIRNIYFSREEKSGISIYLHRYKVDVVETFDINDNILTREVTNSTLDLEVVRDSQKQVYALLDPSEPASSSLVLIENTITTYDYDGEISSNYSREHGRSETSTFYDIEDKLSTYKSKMSSINTRISYDSEDRIVMEDTIKVSQKYQNDGSESGDPETEQQTTTHKQTTVDLIETTMTRYVNGEFKGKTSTKQAGQLPGPKKVGQNRNASSSTGDTWTWWDVIHVSDVGEDITISNDLLSRDQLRTLAQDVEAEYSLKKYKADFDILPMPWLRKGMGLKITGIVKDGLGNTFDLGQLTWKIEQISAKMNEKSYEGTMRGVAWL